MPKVIKYSTTTPSGSLRKGNMAIGPGNYDYGLSFYTTIEPPKGGYTVYINKASGGPTIYCPVDDRELVVITNQIADTSYITALECLNYYSGQSDKLCIPSNDSINSIVTDGLVLYLDAKNQSSFLDNQPTINLVSNPDFSNSTTGWNNNQNTTLSIEIINGTRFLKVKSNQTISTPGFLSGNITVSGNTTYTLTIRAYKNDSRSIFLYATGNGTGGSDIVWAYAPNGPNPVTTELTTISRTFTTPSDMTYIRIGALWSGPLTTSEVYVEYMQLEEKSTATSFISGSRSQNTTWYDLSGNGTNGTLTNGPIFSTGSLGSIVFDGTNDYVTLPHVSGQEPLNNVTFEAVIRLTSTSNYKGMFMKSNYQNSNGHIAVHTTSNGYMRLECSDTLGSTRYLDTSTIGTNTRFTPNEIVHFAVTYDGSNIRTYINSELKDTYAWSYGLGNNQGDLELGRFWAGSWAGDIFEFKQYNKALSASEILQNFAASSYPLLVTDAGGVVDSDFSPHTSYTAKTLSSQNLYSSASLVLTAAGYGTGSLYTLKPLLTAVTSSRGSTSTRLTNGGNLLEIATNVPNISYPYTNDKPYYLIEPGATNLLTYSNNPFSNSNNWGTRNLENTTATLYGTNGDVNILKVSENTNNGQHRISSNNSYAGNYTGTKIFTSSFYAKPNGRSRIVIYLDGSIPGYIDLEAGTTTLAGSNAYFKKSKVTKLANGYCYVEITFSKTNATSAAAPYYIEWLADNNNNVTYQGDGTSGILMYGYQLEEMQFGTSYIKTTGTQVTKTASSRGNHLNNLQSLGILSSTGTIYIEGFYKGTSSFYQYVFGQTGYGSFSGVSFSTNQITPSSTYSLSMRIYKSGGYIGDITLDTGYYDGKHFKMCFKYDGTNCHFFYNGVYKGYLQFSGASIDSFFTGTENTANNKTGNGSCLGISSMAMFPTALSDNQCLTLTL